MGTRKPDTTAVPSRTLAYTSGYRVDSLPDCEDPVYRLIAGGNVSHAVRKCHELLLRTLVMHPAGSATLTIRFVFTPALKPAERQARLAITIHVGANDEQVARSLRLLVECSDLAVYYGLREHTPTDTPSFRGQAGCGITRSEQAIRPLHPPEDNPAIPPVYYLCRPFAPSAANDYQGLDRLLDRLTEPVLFECVVEPADVTQERFLHSRYMARLQAINRFHSSDDDERGALGDPFEPDAYPRQHRAHVVPPLRRRDPIADDVLSIHRRFHEGLTQPHLAFRMRALAQTPAVARLVAAVVAESAFEDGSYRLWPFSPQSAPRDHPQAHLVTADDTSLPSLDLVLGEHAEGYRGFCRLAHVATVDELLSACSLPLASRSSFRCIRKNTEPPLVPRDALLVFGHDE